jgi:hypothetical protein
MTARENELPVAAPSETVSAATTTTVVTEPVTFRR